MRQLSMQVRKTAQAERAKQMIKEETLNLNQELHDSQKLLFLQFNEVQENQYLDKIIEQDEIQEEVLNVAHEALEEVIE